VASEQERAGRCRFKQPACRQQQHRVKALLPNFQFATAREDPAPPRLPGMAEDARKAGRVPYTSQPPARLLPPQEG